MMLFNNIKFDELMQEWLKFHEMEVGESTMYGYIKEVKYLCNFNIAHKKVRDISSSTIQDLYSGFQKSGKKRSTIISYNKVINMSLNYAVEKKYIKENPCKNVVLPKKNIYEIEPFVSEEVEKLLKIPAREWFLDACEIAFRTGMRKGEIFGLKKDVINFNKDFLMVKRGQTLNKKGRVVLSTPKTKTSRRRIDCDEETMRILWRRYNVDDSPFIFSYDDGRMLIPWSLSDTLKKKSKAAGIKGHRFHDLRHGHATYLLINNVHPKIVQERLGHANVGITLDTYSHLIPGLQKTAVEALNKLTL